jgi:hypothetical protein
VQIQDVRFGCLRCGVRVSSRSVSKVAAGGMPLSHRVWAKAHPAYAAWRPSSSCVACPLHLRVVSRATRVLCANHLHPLLLHITHPHLSACRTAVVPGLLLGSVPKTSISC